jgi:hypothetical protein
MFDQNANAWGWLGGGENTSDNTIPSPRYGSNAINSFGSGIFWLIGGFEDVNRTGMCSKFNLLTKKES